MGFLTLAAMKDELALSLGDAHVGADERLTRWINLGYMEVAALRCYHDLQAIDTTITTVDGTRSYALEDDVFALLSVADLDNKFRLIKATPQKYHSFDRESEDSPRFWTRIGNSIYLWPTPDDAYDLEVFYVKEPAVLADDDDVTVLPNVYDRAVLWAAERNALLALKKKEEAILTYQSFQNYMAQVQTEATIERSAIGGGLQPIDDFDDLTFQETDVP